MKHNFITQIIQKTPGNPTEEEIFNVLSSHSDRVSEIISAKDVVDQTITIAHKDEKVFLVDLIETV